MVKANELKLVTNIERANTRVRELAAELSEKAVDDDCIDIAEVLLYCDGRSFVTSYSQGKRTLLLGGVADLQYTLAKAGDQ